MQELSWFDNPPKRRRKLYGAAAAAHAKKTRRKTRKPKGVRKMARRRRKLYGAAAAAHAKARGRGRTRRSRPRKVARRRTHRRTSVATARRAGRQLRYRRSNPPFSVRGIIGQLQQGAIDATFVVGGKAGTRIIAGFIPVERAGAMGLAVQVAAALAVGFLGRQISPNASKMMLAGGLSAPIETFIKSMNIPFISANLGDGEGYYAVGSYPMGSYPMASYPDTLSDGDVSDEAMYQ